MNTPSIYLKQKKNESISKQMGTQVKTQLQWIQYVFHQIKKKNHFCWEKKSFS